MRLRFEIFHSPSRLSARARCALFASRLSSRRAAGCGDVALAGAEPRHLRVYPHRRRLIAGRGAQRLTVPLAFHRGQTLVSRLGRRRPPAEAQRERTCLFQRRPFLFGDVFPETQLPTVLGPCD